MTRNITYYFTIPPFHTKIILLWTWSRRLENGGEVRTGLIMRIRSIKKTNNKILPIVSLNNQPYENDYMSVIREKDTEGINESKI